MQGTEKQVAWGTQIKAAKMADIAPALDSMAARLAGKPAELSKVEAVRNTIEAKDAAWWIERRDMVGMDFVRAAAAGK